jgi:methyl-accepting chemotaxis protein
VASSRIPKNLFLSTSAVCAGMTAAFALCLTVGRHPASYAAIAATAAAAAWWVKYVWGVVPPVLRLMERMDRGRPRWLPKPKLPPEYEAVASEVESSGVALRAVLRTCYSLVAAINDSESVSLRIRTDVFGKMAELEESIAGLRGALVTLREVRPLASAADWQEAAVPAPKVSELVDVISASLEEMTAVVGEIRHDAKELLSSSGETSYSVSRLDSFLQDMVRSGKELESSTENANRFALDGIKVIEEMEKENAATIASVKKAAKSVSTLGMWSQEIGKIIQVIKDIADETNLLALNVAIIASQSGEHGKAFGVVAEEIRGLAERTSSSTKEISDLITTVQTSVANVMEEMKESVERVERGEVLVGNAGKVIDRISESFESARNMAQRIASKTTEHRMDSNNVVRSFQNVAEIARRLDAYRPARGPVPDRGTDAARMLKVLTGALAPAQAEKVPVANYAGVGASGGAGASAGGNDGGAHGESDSIELVDKGIRLLDSVDVYLDSVRDGLTVYFDAVGNAATLIRSIARQLNVPGDSDGFKKCWEEFEHSEELKSSCPAYGRGEWRCFLSEDIDRRLCGGPGHGSGGCYACTVFRENMERLLPESECSPDE